MKLVNTMHGRTLITDNISFLIGYTFITLKISNTTESVGSPASIFQTLCSCYGMPF